MIDDDDLKRAFQAVAAPDGDAAAWRAVRGRKAKPSPRWLMVPLLVVLVGAATALIVTQGDDEGSDVIAGSPDTTASR